MTHPTDSLRLVPVEPTPEIIRAMCIAVENGEFMDPADPAWVDGYDAWIPSVKAAWKDALAAAPASPLPEGSGWQDISTAPKDGTCFLWCCLDDLDGNAGMHVVFWDHGEFRYASDHEKFVGDPVDSWMPLPAAPTGAK